MQTSLSATQARLGACRVQTRRQLRLGVVCAAKQKQQQQQKVQYGANCKVLLQTSPHVVLIITSLTYTRWLLHGCLKYQPGPYAQGRCLLGFGQEEG